MDQYLDNRQHEVLWNLLADPADNGQSHIYNLQRLVDEFPQSGLLHTLLMRAESGAGGYTAVYSDPKVLYTIVNYPESLAEVDHQQIVQQLGQDAKYASGVDIAPDQYTPPFNHFDDEPEEIVVSEPLAGAAEEINNVIEDEPIIPEPVIELPGEQPEPVIEELHTIEPLESGDEGDYLIDAGADLGVQPDETGAIAEIPAEDLRAEAETAVFEEEVLEPVNYSERLAGDQVMKAELPTEDQRTEIGTGIYEEEIPDLAYEHVVVSDEESPVAGIDADDERAAAVARVYGEEIPEWPGENEAVIDEEAVPAENEYIPPAENIDDDVYDEIVGIENISFTPAAKQAATPAAEVTPSAENSSDEQHAISEETPIDSTAKEETDKLIAENLVSNDYFIFENIAEHGAEEPESGLSSFRAVEDGPEEDAATEHENVVSKYDDDKMPYTFMWWLNKTRREHAGVYQPFKLDTTQAIRYRADDMLQQQYYENIFHMGTIDEVEKGAGSLVDFDMQNKEDRIIKKFLTEEPQISPPSSDKLDNENKAKKSAEDRDELVTETLARIYVDQMLYHKAIGTYKKLMLKFPEKSRYFADQIELLERKIN
ncbi:MAG: hypothetical protein JST32_00655 [Bacteroidetes bacterium]|nr:hypothetical protein [Bacteroidota bacterium]